jgi:putative nucleotidyltransferase with HDIG domain
MVEYADHLEDIPVEVLRKELDKILLSEKPSRLFKIMSRRRILKYVMPELEACIGCLQDPKFHKYDVFTHCIKTCDNTEKDIVMRLAGLLHDIGKVGTRKIIAGKITFHKHEMLSVKLAQQFMNRLRYDGRTKEKVLWLIRMHMYHYTRKYTDPAIRRFIKRAVITDKNIDNLSEHPIFKLRAAERLGNGFKTEAVTQRQLDFEERIKGAFKRGAGLQIKDLDINGDLIIKVFDLKPGVQIGAIFNHLLEQVQQDSSRNNRLDLIDMIVSYLKDQKQFPES